MIDFIVKFIKDIHKKGLLKESDFSELYAAAEALRAEYGENSPLYLSFICKMPIVYHSVGRMKDAERLYLEAIERVDVALGKYSSLYISTLNSLGLLHRENGRFKEAEPIFIEVVEKTFKKHGEKSVEFATSISNLGSLYCSMGRFSEALRLLERSLTITGEVCGKISSEYAGSLSDLAELYHIMCRYKEAELLFAEALRIRREVYGDRSAEYSSSLNNLGMVYYATGQLKEAEDLYLESIKIDTGNMDNSHPDFAQSLNNLALLYKELGKYGDAEALYLKAIHIIRSVLGDSHPVLARYLCNLASLCQLLGRYCQSESLYLESLEIRGRVLGKMNHEYAESLNGLGELYYAMGKYDEALDFYQKARHINKEVMGEKSLYYAKNLNDIAVLKSYQGLFQEAEDLLLSSLEIRRELLGEEHKECATCLNNLAILYHHMGRYERAGELYRRALEIREKVLGREHNDYATSLLGIAMLNHFIGRYEEAEAAYIKTLNIKRSTLGEMHPEYAATLCNLALLYHVSGRLMEAEQKYIESVVIRSIALGQHHPDFAYSLNNLAVLYIEKGRFKEAESLILDAMDILHKAFGNGHFLQAFCLNNLAWISESMGDLNRAESIYFKAVQKMRLTVGELHPDYARCLCNLSHVQARRGLVNEALAHIRISIDINNRLLYNLSGYLPEQHLLSFARKLEGETDLLLTLVWRYFNGDREAVRFSFDTVLRRKAIANEAAALRHQTMLGSTHHELKEKFEKLSHARSMLAKRILGGPYPGEITEEYRNILAELESTVTLVEEEIAREAPQIALWLRIREAGGEAVAKALPPKTVLIEYIKFYPLTMVRGTGVEREKARYLAFVIMSDCLGEVLLVDLGQAEKIELQIAGFRKIITSTDKNSGDMEPASGNSIEAACRSLYDTLFLPVLEKLKRKGLSFGRVIVSPDGEVYRVPFEAFISPQGRFLIEDYLVSYVTAGRDVLGFGDGQSLGNMAVIVADPDYNLEDVAQSQKGEDNQGWLRTSRLLSQIRGLNDYYEPLHLTRAEGKQAAQMLERRGIGVKELLGHLALDRDVKSVEAPLILHIATHGFFLPDLGSKERPSPHHERLIGENEFKLIQSFKPIFEKYLENPLLRSGLVLAGVNTVISGKNVPENAEDGILTALDVLTINLIGTELVILSACETGVGEVSCGEGVYGLRKSFVLSGAKTLVTSLWKVPDIETKRLVRRFYQSLLEGEDKMSALRDAKIKYIDEQRNEGIFANPWFWAGFICQGDTGTLAIG